MWIKDRCAFRTLFWDTFQRPHSTVPARSQPIAAFKKVRLRSLNIYEVYGTRPGWAASATQSPLQHIEQWHVRPSTQQRKVGLGPIPVSFYVVGRRCSPVFRAAPYVPRHRSTRKTSRHPPGLSRMKKKLKASRYVLLPFDSCRYVENKISSTCYMHILCEHCANRKTPPSSLVFLFCWPHEARTCFFIPIRNIWPHGG